MIGAMATTIVSFNIEALSVVPFALLDAGRGVAFRTTRPVRFPWVHPETPGRPGRPVWFAHGLLRMGDVVMTKSEYDAHVQGYTLETPAPRFGRQYAGDSGDES